MRIYKNTFWNIIQNIDKEREREREIKRGESERKGYRF